MGPFPYIVVQDLRFKDGQFSQTNTYFTDRSFVSWDPTSEQPKTKNDEWHWLAGNTVRVRKRTGDQHIAVAGQYETDPVKASGVNDEYEYRQSWNSEEKGLVHLALPPNFVVEIPSLDGHTPFHAKFDRGRICLDWFTTHDYPTDFTFQLIRCEDNEFVKIARQFERDIQPFLVSNSVSQNLESQAGKLERTVKVVSLIVSAISGILVLIPRAFGPFDYAAEAFLAVCVLGFVVFGVSIILAKPRRRRRSFVGWTAVLAAPLVASWLWYSFLRLSRTDEETVRREVARGDAELIVNNPAGALEHYGNAALLAPRRGSIRAKMKDAEGRMSPKKGE
jgi:hypothetical protein